MKSGDMGWHGEAGGQINTNPNPCFAAQLPSFVTFKIDLNLSEPHFSTKWNSTDILTWEM